MFRLSEPRFAGLLLLAASIFAFSSCQYMVPLEKVKPILYDGPEQAAQQDLEMTRDPQTGLVPWHKLLEAKQQAEVSKTFARQYRLNALSWEERGPYSDIVGPSNGNPRANDGVTAGRIRALMVDSLDPAKKTVFAGSVSGGLWKTTDITASPATWTLVDDFMPNLAIAAICQDPRPGSQSIMYLCTGESYFNADAVQGVGVFKSTNGGATWTFLSNTASYNFGTRIVCDFQGNVYLATRNGLYRSTNGGDSWDNITPAGVSTRICDLEISSTSGPARLHVVAGIFTTQSYRYTDIPSTVSSSLGWNTPATPFPSFSQRAEIAVSGNTLYALPSNNSTQAPTVYKSTDGGNNWNTAGSTPNSHNLSSFANGQAWYDLSVRINPADPNECIVGGIDLARTVDGGANWTRISAWAGSLGQYVHADQHDIQWWDGGNKLLFACDGGVHFSTDKGLTIRDRNSGLRIKQFYSVAMHPTAQSNYFLAGAQDNGVHQLSSAGLSTSVEVTGGDGAYVAIDQSNPSYQFGSYVYSNFRRSSNSGSTWTSFSFSSANGRFINPWDFDRSNGSIYASHSPGNYFFWENARTASSIATSVTNTIAIPELDGQMISAVQVSPYTPNRVFFGTGTFQSIGGKKLIRVDNANTTPAVADITPPLPIEISTAYLNCVAVGSSDQKLMAIYSNYNMNNIWLSNDGGTTWTECDGNLPNMPVRWAIFHPDSDTKAIIATEAGVWETDLLNGSSTNWVANPNFPNVKVSMLKYRASDRTIAAGTHGRGVWTATIPQPSGFSFSTPTAVSAACPAPQSMSTTLNVISEGGFVNPVTLSATGNPTGTSVSFSTNPVTPGGSTTVVLNGTNTLATGTYNITITGTASGATLQTRVLSFVITGGTAPAITTQPLSQTVCPGTTVSFSVAANSGTYQWQSSVDGGTSYTNISGATSSTYTIANTTVSLSGRMYRCVVTSACNNSTISSAATLSVTSGISISSSPSSVSLCVGGSTIFSTTASGAGLTYRWEKSTNGGSTYTPISGATTSQFTLNNVTLAMNGDRYRCVVTGACSVSEISAAATLTVYAPVAITAAPANVEICSGADASFTIVASSVPAINYQWQVSTDGGTSWTSIPGANAAIYSMTGVPIVMNGNRYRCLVSSNTCTTPVVSASAILTVRLVPGIGLAASPLSSLLPGQTTTLTATPSASTGGVMTTTWSYGTGSNLQPITPNPGNSLVVGVTGLGAYQVGIREAWPSGLFCSALSPVVTITANVSSKLFIFPSPNDGNFSVSYYYAGTSSTKRQLVIFDNKGARVYQREFAVAGPYTILPVDLRNQARGIYYVVVGDAAGNKLIEGKVHVR